MTYQQSAMGLILILMMTGNGQAAQSGQTQGSVALIGPAADAQCQFNSISQALTTSATSLRVVAGEYLENLDLRNRDISLTGGYASCAAAAVNTQPTSMSTIRGNATQSVININNVTSGATVELYNLVVENGLEPETQLGGGLSLSGGVTLIAKNLITQLNTGPGLGVKNNGTSEVFLEDFIATENSAFNGGGIICNNTKMTLLGRTAIYFNIARGNGTNQPQSGRGGGIYAGTGCEMTLFSDQDPVNGPLLGIHNNMANHHGGGIYATGSNTLINLIGQPGQLPGGTPVGDARFPVRVTANRADVDNNLDDAHGGGVAAENGAILWFQGVNVSDNSNTGKGGAVALFNNGNLLTYQDPLLPCNHRAKCNRFIANSADFGGAIYASSGAEMHLISLWVEGNLADSGSAMSLHDAGTTARVNDAVFYRNGDNILVNRELIQVTTGAELTMETSTLADNTIRNRTFQVGSNAVVDLFATLVYMNNASIPLSSNSSSATFDGQCLYVYDNTGLSGSVIQTTLTDPFIDRLNGNLHLKPNSTAIDVCSDVQVTLFRDMDGQSRGWDDPRPNVQGTIDIGADESWASEVIFMHGYED